MLAPRRHATRSELHMQPQVGAVADLLQLLRRGQLLSLSQTRVAGQQVRDLHAALP